MLALGFHTGYDQEGNLDRFGDAAWINGGSPTEGFLKFGADGPFKSFYNSIGGTPWLDALFMLGLLGVGLGLTFGIGMRAATAVGALMYVLMWTVALPPENHPFLDEHILGALSMAVLVFGHAGQTWGFGKQWDDISLVRVQPLRSGDARQVTSMPLGDPRGTRHSKRGAVRLYSRQPHGTA